MPQSCLKVLEYKRKKNAKTKNVLVTHNGKYSLYLFFTLRNVDLRKQFLPMMVVRVMIPKRTDVAIEMTVNSYPSPPKWPVALKFLVSFCEFSNT